MATATKDEELVKQILEVDHQMDTVFTLWKPVLQTVTENTLTHRGDIEGTDQEGKERDDNIFDQTTSLATQIFKNGMIGLSISESTSWFKLLMEDEFLNNIPEVREYLEEVERRMYTALQRSNFYAAIDPFILDGSSLGTACMYSEEDIGKGVIDFTPIPLSEYRIAKDKNNRINMIHRTFKMTARQLKVKFGKENLTEQMKLALKKSTGKLQEFDIKHAVFPRKEYDPLKIDAKNKPWASVWISMEGQKKDKSKILRESGFDEFPFHIWRMMKETGETYGRCPSINMIKTIIGLNEMNKDIMMASQLAVEPPVDVHVNQRETYSRLPRAVNYYTDSGQETKVPDLSLNLPVGYEALKLKQDEINSAYFVDLFLLIASREGTMTATEVLELQGEKVVLLAPIMSSLSTDAYSSILDRVFSIEQTAGRMPEPPEVLQGEKFGFTYLGPLAQAQEQVFKTKSIKAALVNVSQMIQLSPEVLSSVLKNFNFNEISRELWTSSGGPQKFLISIQDVKRQEELERLQAAQEQQKQDTERLIASAKTAAEADSISEGAITDAFAAQGVN